ncbi:MAG: translocation/assembly module TamB domain-containing protein [Bdellovibrionota bacterium]
MAKKKKQKLVFALLIGLAVILFGLLFWAPFINSYVKDIIEAQVSKKIEGKFAVEYIDLSIIPPSISMSNLYFESKNSLIRQAEIPSIEINISPRSLISEVLKIQSVKIENPKIFLDLREMPAKKKKKKKTVFSLPSLTDLFDFEVRQILLSKSFLGIQFQEDYSVEFFTSEAEFESGNQQEMLRLFGDGILRKGEVEKNLDLFTVRLERQEKDVRIKNFQIQGQGLSVQASGKIFPQAQLAYSAKIDLSVVDQWLMDFRLLERQQFFEGDVAVEGNATGSLENLSTKGKISTPVFSLQGGKIHEIHADYFWQKDRFRFVKGQLQFGEESNAIFFRAENFGPHHVGTYSVTGKEIEYSYIQSFIDWEVKPILTATVDVESSGKLGLAPFVFDGNYSLHTPNLAMRIPDLLLPYLPIEFEDLNLKGPIGWSSEKGISLRNGVLTAQGLSGSFYFDFLDVDRIDGLIQVEVLQASGLFAPNYPASGYGNVSCKIDLFKRQDFSIDLQMDLNQAQYQEKSPHQLKGKIRFTRNHVSIPSIELFSSNENRATFQGEFELSEVADTTESMEAKGELQNFDMAWVSALAAREYPLAEGVGGQVSGTLSLSSFKEDFTGKLLANSKLLRFHGIDFDHADVQISMSEEGVSFDRIQIKNRESQLSLSGKFLQGIYESIEITGTQVPMEFFTSSTIARSFSTHSDLSVFLQGKAADPKLSAQVVFYQETPGSLNTVATLDAKGIFSNVDLQLHHLDGSIALRSNVSFNAPYRMNISGSLKSFPIFSFIPESESFLSGSLKLEGEFFKPTSWEGVVDVQTLEVRKIGFQYKLSNPIHLDVQKGLFSFSQIDFASGDHQLQVSGLIDALGSIELKVKGEFPLFLLSLIPFGLQRAEGFGEIDLSVLGDWEAPIAKGQLYVTGGYLQFEDIPKAFEELEFFASISQNRIYSDDFSLQMSGGSFQGQAELILAWEPDEITMDVSGDVNRVQWDFPEWVPVLFSGPMSIEGKATHPLIRGDFIVHEGLYRDQWDWKSQILSFRSLGRRERVYKEEEESFRYDLRFQTQGDQFRFKNDVAEGIARGDIQLIGSNVEIGMLGQIEVIEGTVVFLGNEFILEPGVINFVSPTEIDLDFDLNARTRIQQTDILLDIRTEGEEISAYLSSQPVKDESTIVALLTLGIDSNELAPQTNPEEGLSPSLIPTMLSGPVQTRLEKGLRKIRLIDSFQFVPYFSEDTKTTGLKLVVVKNLFPKVRLLYSTDLFESNNENTFSLQQDLNKNLSVQGNVRDNKQEANQELDLGVDVEFRVDF